MKQKNRQLKFLLKIEKGKKEKTYFNILCFDFHVIFYLKTLSIQFKTDKTDGQTGIVHKTCVFLWDISVFLLLFVVDNAKGLPTTGGGSQIMQDRH